MRKVDVVIPVYKGLDETRCALHSVLRTIDHDWARIVVINDASPEPEITAFLSDLREAHPHIILLENEKNLGFVATANRGMSYAPERDIVLLNSDVEVAGDWLNRLRIAAYHNKKVASITPFSNNATIFSFPNFCSDNNLPFDMPLSEIDGCFAALFGPDDVIPVPTTMGHCMYISRQCLDEIGLFDVDTFGQGYGEENDWCQRAEKAGWSNLHLANCFVYHAGGVSFGAEQQSRSEKAQVLLAKKHPQYAADVARYLEADPAREKRGRALLSLIVARKLPVALMVSHNMGGGAQQHVEELVELYRGRVQFLRITPEDEGLSVLLNFFDGTTLLQDGLHFDIPGEYEKLIALLRDLGVGRVHFHHTMGLPPRLWLLGSDLGVGHDLTIHDYYLVNGNPTLTDARARYVSETDKDFDQRCASHYPLPPQVNAEQWRDNQRLLVERADRVIFPSADACQRFSRFFSVKSAIVAWHPDYARSQPYPAVRWQYDRQRPLRVLVIGALSREKGADMLEAVALAMAEESVEFHLLGYAYRALNAAVVSHGPYRNDEVYGLIEGIAPDVMWYPAQWPETYSYTLSAALHCGLAVVAPDLGAFSERLTGRAHSTLAAWGLPRTGWVEFWQRVLQQGGLPAGERLGLNPEANLLQDGDFYIEEYPSAIAIRQGALRLETLDSLADNYHLSREGLSPSERLLRRIWRLSRSPLVAKCVALVPFRLKQSLKRRLSSRPMHDIVYKE
ncbi:MAG: glycosyltransferase [Pseudomonadota bacterium]